MSQLQLGLLLLGAVVLLAMAVYNAWLARKNRPKQAQAVGPHDGDDALGGNQDVEPSMDASAFDLDRFPVPVIDKKPGLDALIDVLAPIMLESAVSGDAVLAAMPPTRRVGSKPFAIEGLNSATHGWEFPLAGQRYSQLQAGVQLANRSGALNDIEFSEFVMKTQSFCDAVNGTPDFPVMRDEVNRARELDQFASDHDAQLGFVVRARRAAWSPSYIQQTAARLGFVPGAMAGRMLLASSLGTAAPVLGLSFDTQAALDDDPTQTALREVVLSLDVAQVVRAEKAFERMREAALALAKEMEGTVTDDNGMALPPDAMDVIAAELENLYNTLDQRELAAGSPLARRLFS
jgi:hypothetical protein